MYYEVVRLFERSFGLARRWVGFQEWLVLNVEIIDGLRMDFGFDLEMAPPINNSRDPPEFLDFQKTWMEEGRK